MICFVQGGEQSLSCVWVNMFCSSDFHVTHGFTYVVFFAGIIAFVTNMGWVLVSVLEFENALNFLSLPQDVNRVLVVSE